MWNTGCTSYIMAPVVEDRRQIGISDMSDPRKRTGAVPMAGAFGSLADTRVPIPHKDRQHSLARWRRSG